MPPSPPSPDTATAARKRWLSLLSRADPTQLETGMTALAEVPEYALLRPPETGLVMVRGRAGGNGRRFNLGEMTVTRCSIRTADGRVGHGYVSGSDRRHAELVAVFDAVLQEEGDCEALEAGLLAPIEAQLAARHAAAAAKSAATKVEFFTMVRSESET